jgi:hypothetical protein
MVSLRVLPRLVVCGLLAAPIVSCGGSEDELRAGKTVLRDDFSCLASGWDSGTFEEREYSYVAGAYRIFVGEGKHVIFRQERPPADCILDERGHLVDRCGAA